MSEAPDQLAGAEAPVAEAPAGVEAAAPATTTTDDDIDTDAFDRAPAPPEDADAALEGQAEGEEGEAAPGDPVRGGETIEIEVAGKKVAIPKELEPLLMFQSDYTKKTQDVAERGRALDTKAQELDSREAQQAESLKSFRAEHMAIGKYEEGIAGIDAQLGEYAKLSPTEWNELRANDPEKYEAHRANRQILRDTRADYAEALGKATDDLKGKETKFAEQQASARSDGLAKAWRETNTALSTKIEGWSPTGETTPRMQEIATFFVKELGVPAEELRESTDPRVWIAADRLMKAEAELARLKTASKQTTATEAALKSQTVTPAVNPAGGGAKPTGVRDELSIEEWTRRRNAQIARKAVAR